MILLDTNVVSEPLKRQPDHAVIHWLNAREPEELYLPAIVAAELYYGWSILPEGRRRHLRRDQIDRIVEQFEQRIVPFDLDAAAAYGDIMAAARAVGRSLPTLDGQIAAIARARNATLATRNVKHFESTGVAIVDPWNDTP